MTDDEKTMLFQAKDSERRARNALDTIRNARAVETAVIQEMNNALRESLPLLIKLGDFIGNDNGRCETILKVRDALRHLEELIK